MPQRPISRRRFLGAAALAASMPAFAQTPNTPAGGKALDDPSIAHGPVTFRSGEETIGGYLARPKKDDRHPIVIVVAGSAISEEYISNTTAILAQAGFAALAPDIFSLQLETMTPDQKRNVLAARITDERVLRDIQAGVDYVQAQPFAGYGPVGIIGFCFGGRMALLYAAKAKNVGAVVPFYGNLRLPPDMQRPTGPFDVISRIAAPMQGHYSTRDPGIPVGEARDFVTKLRGEGTQAELHLYDADNGFFAYTRKSWNQDAAKLAQGRMVAFLQRHLKDARKRTPAG